ncbi:MAG: SUMF1/EgtB/PvdO family nonheme iron enzyme [Anaerolineae bacterium]|nr:SUMF1/EgtB/PvdO family nonheme iron enzyme [Anaerolineae bacterium]
MDLTTLLHLLITHFNHEELKTLCFTLGIPHDELDGPTRSALARELLAHMQRRGRIAELEPTLRQERPDIPWPPPGAPTHPATPNQHHQELIQLLSSERYQLDSRFVQLILLLDQGPDAEGIRYIPDSQRGRFNNLLTLLQESGEQHLVLLGKPGSGKTTLLRRLQLDLAWRSLERANPSQGLTPGIGQENKPSEGPNDPPFTLFASLNGYRGDPPPPPYEWLAAEWQLRHRDRHPTLPDFATLFQNGHLTLLLDGLNELPHPDRDEYQKRVGQWQAFLAHYAHYGNRVLFSCRNLDYSSPLGSDAVPVRRVQVEPLTPAQIEQFLTVYLGEQAPLVWATMRHDPQQLSLFSVPFFLRLLVDHLHLTAQPPANDPAPNPQYTDAPITNNPYTPPGRAALLTGFVRRALHRELARRHYLFVQNNLLSEDDQHQVLAGAWATPTALPDEGPLIPHLETLAYQMQAGRLTREANQVRLLEKEARALLAHPQAELLIRAGVQLNVLDKDVSKREITYGHQLLQEYFAARRLGQTPEPARLAVPWREAEIRPSLAEQLAALSKSEELPPLPPTGWEESGLLAAAMTPNPEQFIRALMAANLPLAARCANLPELTLSPALKKELQEALAARINNPQADLRPRISAAEALAELGDSRFNRHTGPYGEYLLPPLVTIPPGRYPIGDDQSSYADEKPAHTVEIAGFAMAAYPLTNAEYRLFMDAGGYEDEQWWQTDAARAWRQGESSNDSALQQGRELQTQLKGFSEDAIAQANVSPAQVEFWLWLRNASDEERDQQYAKWSPSGKVFKQPEYWDDSRFNHPSQPVVGICWFEALAYCAWLSAQVGERYTLPTEVEWEAAARGTAGRVYPYGRNFDPTLGNTFETHLYRTSPVGVFPGGRTPEGVYDLSGNVWEWTSTLWGDKLPQPTYAYPYNRDDGREDPQDGTSRRVVRGGSWFGVRIGARAACRGRYPPDNRGNARGARVVRRSPSP